MSLSRRRAVWIAVLSIVVARPSLGDTSQTERALLRSEWTGLLKLLGPPQRNEGASNQFLRGHATLALNRNDDSVSTFLSVARADAVKEWDEWTNDFVRRHVDSSVAWYLRGDALARREAFGEAIDAFDRAVKISESNGLAWNARGVVQALKGRWSEAGNDFAAAAAKAPNLADAYANAGTVYVLQSIGRKDTIERTYGAANSRSRQFRIARIGAASLQFGIGDWKAADAILSAEARATDPIGRVAAQNLAVLKYSEREVLLRRAESETVAGTSVTTQSRQRQAELEALNSKILAADQVVAGTGGFNNFVRDSRLPLALMGSSGRAVSLGIQAVQAVAGTESLEKAATKVANDSSAAFDKGIVNNALRLYRDNPTSPGANNAISNLANSRYSSELAAQATIQKISLPPLAQGQSAGGAILDFQRAYTSKGGWGMYVPFGLVYTGFDMAGGASMDREASRNVPDGSKPK